MSSSRSTYTTPCGEKRMTGHVQGRAGVRVRGERPPYDARVADTLLPVRVTRDSGAIRRTLGAPQRARPRTSSFGWWILSADGCSATLRPQRGEVAGCPIQRRVADSCICWGSLLVADSWPPARRLRRQSVRLQRRLPRRRLPSRRLRRLLPRRLPLQRLRQPHRQPPPSLPRPLPHPPPHPRRSARLHQRSPSRARR